MTTITVYGTAGAVERVRAIIAGSPGIEVHRTSDPSAVSDGTGRFRLYLTVEV